MKILLIFLQIFLVFNIEFFSEANKIRKTKEILKKLKKLLTNYNIYYIINT